MTDVMAGASSQNGNSPAASSEAGAMPAASVQAPLDDVMIAMDVVDTLRHDEQIVEREIDEEARKTRLIERLRDIYHGQGIEVPDRILEEGVKALDEHRFTFTPPAPGWKTSLARLYVTRHEWGRLVAGVVLGIAVTWTAWYAWVERPRALRIAAETAELVETLPQTLRGELARIEATGADAPARQRAATIADQGIKAAAAGDRTAARSAERELRQLRETLGAQYTIRVVNRRGVATGFSRVPRVNPNARNYYIVVEAIDPQGKPLARTITNEETSENEHVETWAVRVPKHVYDAIRADKADDGIIQSATVATKARGKLQPDWHIETSGGALTRWPER